MGKRKSKAAPAAKKKREPLATSFKCVFCNHDNSVSVKIDKKAGVGSLSCKQCHQAFQTTTNYLSQPVDVYSDWIDACDTVAKDQLGGSALSSHLPASQQPMARSHAGLAPGEKMTEEDAGFIDDEGADDAEADFLDDD